MSAACASLLTGIALPSATARRAPAPRRVGPVIVRAAADRDHSTSEQKASTPRQPAQASRRCAHTLVHILLPNWVDSLRHYSPGLNSLCCTSPLFQQWASSGNLLCPTAFPRPDALNPYFLAES